MTGLREQPHTCQGPSLKLAPISPALNCPQVEGSKQPTYEDSPGHALHTPSLVHESSPSFISLFISTVVSQRGSGFSFLLPTQQHLCLCTAAFLARFPRFYSMEVDFDVNGKALHGGSSLPTPPVPELPNGITESLRLEKTLKTIQSNHPPLLTAVPRPSAPPLPFP